MRGERGERPNKLTMNKCPDITVIPKARLNPCAQHHTPSSKPMYRHLILAALLFAPANLFAQDAATLAAQREAEERERRLTTRITRLEESNEAQQRRLEELFRENGNLRRQLVEFENRFKNSQNGAVSQSDVRKIYDKMAEIEKNRQARSEERREG